MLQAGFQLRGIREQRFGLSTKVFVPRALAKVLLGWLALRAIPKYQLPEQWPLAYKDAVHPFVSAIDIQKDLPAKV